MTAPLTPEWRAEQADAREVEREEWIERLESDWNQERTRRLAAEAEVDRLRVQVAAVEALAARREKIASEMAGRMDLDGTRSYLANSTMARELRAALASGEQVQP